MGLDLAQTFQQLENLAQRLGSTREERAHRLAEALQAMHNAESSTPKSKLQSSEGRPFMAAGVVEGIAARYAPVQAPQDFCVVSVDGSHIDVDRHMPVRSYLINIGGCSLTYGSNPNAHLFSHPYLYSEASKGEGLYMTNPAPETKEEMAVEGPLVGLKRAVEEVKALAEVVEGVPSGVPVLALIDGSLVLWGLSGRGYPPFVRDEILQEGLIPALDRLRETAQRRTLTVGSYISLPQSTEVVHTLRLFLCPNDAAQCRQRCTIFRSTQEPCDTLNGFLDRHLFQELLAPGERSGLFFTNSSIVRDFYGPHWVYFYYVNVGEEIARVEVPQWVAEDEGLLALSHTLVVDQCRRGNGYPAAIMEAHEQAVINGTDRESFKLLIEEALTGRRLPVFTSEKNRSKRIRWL